MKIINKIISFVFYATYIIVAVYVGRVLGDIVPKAYVVLGIEETFLSMILPFIGFIPFYIVFVLLLEKLRKQILVELVDKKD